MLDYVAHLRNDGELMASAAERDLDGLDSHVPSCPDWNVAKLIIHMGQHHRWVADAIRRAGDDPERPSKPGLRGVELVQWLRSGYSELADLLATKADEERAWTWWTDQSVGFWRRRTSLETLVHRWDLENATGSTSPLDPELSSDGVDEMLFIMMADGAGPYSGRSGRVVLRTSDTAATWVLDLKDGLPARPQRGGDGDAEISGSAADLLLYVWGRVPEEVVDGAGDESLISSFKRWLAD